MKGNDELIRKGDEKMRKNIVAVRGEGWLKSRKGEEI